MLLRSTRGNQAPKQLHCQQGQTDRQTDQQTDTHTHLSVAVVGLQNMLELSVYQFGSEWIIFQVQCQSQKLSFNEAKKYVGNKTFNRI